MVREKERAKHRPSSKTHINVVACCRVDRGRIAYLDSCGGLQHLVNVCQRACELQQQQPSDAELTRMAVSIGCLHNVTNENGKNCIGQKEYIYIVSVKV